MPLVKTLGEFTTIKITKNKLMLHNSNYMVIATIIQNEVI